MNLTYKQGEKLLNAILEYNINNNTARNDLLDRYYQKRFYDKLKPIGVCKNCGRYVTQDNSKYLQEIGTDYYELYCNDCISGKKLTKRDYEENAEYVKNWIGFCEQHHYYFESLE